MRRQCLSSWAQTGRRQRLNISRRRLRIAGHNIGNGLLDLGGGNSRSRSAKSSLVSLISIDRALSRTCFSLLALGIAIISG